jgi:hypothetical protein
MSGETLENGVKVGQVIRGFGLHNAGHHYTVLQVGRTRGRVYLEEHLTGRKFWTFTYWYLSTDCEVSNA